MYVHVYVHTRVRAACIAIAHVYSIGLSLECNTGTYTCVETSWILDVSMGSQRLVSKGADTIPGKAAASDLRRQEDEDVQRTCRSSSKRVGVSTRPACFLTLQDPAVGNRGHGWADAEAWTRCTARHLTGTGASTGLRCLRTLPRTHMRLILLLKGEGAMAIISTWKTMMTTRLTAKDPFQLTHRNACS